MKIVCNNKNIILSDFMVRKVTNDKIHIDYFPSKDLNSVEKESIATIIEKRLNNSICDKCQKNL